MHCPTPVGTVTLTLAPSLPRDGQGDEGKKGQESVRLHISSHRTPQEETRDWPSKRRSKGRKHQEKK